MGPRQTPTTTELHNELARLIDDIGIHDILHTLTTICYDRSDSRPESFEGCNWREVARQLTRVEDFTSRLSL